MTTPAIEHLLPRRPTRPLPRRCRPAHDETIDSYLRRLAAANSLKLPALIDYVTATTSRSSKKVNLTNLATITGQSPYTLAYALPETRAQLPHAADLNLKGRTLGRKPNTIRPACRKCVTRYSDGLRVDVWRRHDQNVCLRHQLWIGPGADDPCDQIDLTNHPDILHAQIRHLRLIRRHGRGIVRTANIIAGSEWDTVTSRGWGTSFKTIRDIRLTSHFGHENWRIHYWHPVYAAARYPEIITLTGMIASPHWRYFAMSSPHTDNDRFREEFQRRLPPACRDLAHHAITISGYLIDAWYEPPA